MRKISSIKVITLCLQFFLVFIVASQVSYHGNTTCARKYVRRNRHMLDVHWLNLDKSIKRRDFMNRMLGFFGFHHYRVPAITPEQIYVPKGLERATDCVSLSLNETVIEIEKVKELQFNKQLNRTVLLTGHCGRSKNNDQMKVLACTISHLLTIYNAVHHHPPTPPASALGPRHSLWKKYALIMEDDLRLAFELDFEQLISSAPKDFDMLQLITTNNESIHSFWNTYRQTGERWIKRDEYFVSWGAGAYLINKERIKEAIDSIVSKVNDNLYIVRIQAVTRKCPEMLSCCWKDYPFPLSPCVLSPYGYEADFFVYNIVFGRTYVTTIPYFLTSAVARQSTLHPDHVGGFHDSAFKMNSNIIHQMVVEDSKLMPNYMNPTCARECHSLGVFCFNQTKTIFTMN